MSHACDSSRNVISNPFSIQCRFRFRFHFDFNLDFDFISISFQFRFQYVVIMLLPSVIIFSISMVILAIGTAISSCVDYRSVL
jgi:putative Mn2+ efflux pump MntP